MDIEPEEEALDDYSMSIKFDKEEDKGEEKISSNMEQMNIGSIVMYKMKFSVNCQGFKTQQVPVKLQKFIKASQKIDPTFKGLPVDDETSTDYIDSVNHVSTKEATLRKFSVISRKQADT